MKKILMGLIAVLAVSAGCSNNNADEPGNDGVNAGVSAVDPEVTRAQQILQKDFIASRSNVCLLSEGETQYPGLYSMEAISGKWGEMPIGPIFRAVAIQVSGCDAVVINTWMGKTLSDVRDNNSYPLSDKGASVVFPAVSLLEGGDLRLSEMAMPVVEVYEAGEIVREIYPDDMMEGDDEYINDFVFINGFVTFNVAPSEGTARDIALYFRTKQKGRYNPVDPDDIDYGYLYVVFNQN